MSRAISQVRWSRELVVVPLLSLPFSMAAMTIAPTIPTAMNTTIRAFFRALRRPSAPVVFIVPQFEHLNWVAFRTGGVVFGTGIDTEQNGVFRERGGASLLPEAPDDRAISPP